MTGSALVVERRGRGPAVMLLHGYTGTARSMSTVARALERDYEVIAPDLPGHGRSAMPARAGYGFDDCIDDLVATLVAGGHERAVWLAINAVRAMQVRVVLDDAGYRVEGPGAPRAGLWADVTRVTRAPGRITIHLRDGSLTHLVVPHGGSADMAAIGADIVRRLDASRGYRQVAE